jgi:hypothetical protein
MAEMALTRIVDRPSTQLSAAFAAALVVVGVGHQFVLGSFLVLVGLLAGISLSGSV